MFREQVRAVMPFYTPLGIVLLIVTYWSGFVLFVPSLFKGRPLSSASGHTSTLDKCGLLPTSKGWRASTHRR